MNNDRLEALLWARIDGTIEPEELAELEAHLRDHPEPRKIERQIVAIAEGLDTLEHEQPPEALRERIDQALHNATPPTSQHDTAERIPPTHPTPTWRSTVLPVAAGLVIGVAVGYLLHPNAGQTIDQSIAAGTMVSPAGDQVSRVDVRLEDGAGHVIAHRDMADIVIDIDLTSEIDVTVTVEGMGGPVRIESLSSTEAATTEVSTHYGWVVVHAVGPCAVSFTAVASATDDPVRLRVASGGVTAAQHWLGPGQEGFEP